MPILIIWRRVMFPGWTYMNKYLLLKKTWNLHSLRLKRDSSTPKLFAKVIPLKIDVLHWFVIQQLLIFLLTMTWEEKSSTPDVYLKLCLNPELSLTIIYLILEFVALLHHFAQFMCIISAQAFFRNFNMVMPKHSFAILTWSLHCLNCCPFTKLMLRCSQFMYPITHFTLSASFKKQHKYLLSSYNYQCHKGLS